MMSTFLDTVGLLALWDVDDQWHAAAECAYERLASERHSIVTTTFVLLECGNAAARRTYRDEVCSLRRTLELRDELVVPTDDDWSNGWEAYQRQEAGRASIVDCVSFVVMRRIGIRQAFTNDRHFQKAGFQTLF